ncbi:MAG TPA: YbaB/EbfC family nucleoid-associated protein [Spirochaetota bacterium]|nr:YbaB/EbfC family nucleoid-associated protein [Spirochaetota bacterium]HPJ40336.1 YbaB/EbfC family nucleoid-associated protein [Spirochaetota bacterium]HPQ55063.1 YbaB/EbfC family nucleoid-associated protein [Spirochaetota bacterium]
MLKGLGDLGNVMKLQKEFKNIQKRLKKTVTEGENADGTVKVRMNGEYKLIGIDIDQGLIDSGDKKKIEKSIITAAEIAGEKIKEEAAQEMKKLTGGMNIPGLGDMFS